MKKNIIFDKNFLNENGLNVSTINSTNIIVETVTQTGDLSIDGNLTISNNLDINGTVLNTSSNELNINKTINTSGTLICNGITNNNATSSNTLLGQYNFFDQVNLNGSSYGVTQNYTNNTNLLATCSFVKSQFVNDISFTGNVNIGKYVTASLYNGSSGPFNIQTNTLGTPIYTNGMDGTGANTGLQVGWNHTALYSETDLLDWAQGGFGGFNFYSISSGFPIKLVASLSINGTSYISDNLGVKNQTPAYDLDVSGNINFTGNIYQNGKIFSGGSSNNFTGNVTITAGDLTVSGNIILNNVGSSSQQDYITISPSTNATPSITLSQTNLPSNGIRCGIADGATSTTCNVQINSNYGVGFYNSSGNPGVYNIWFDVRLGTINATTFNSTSDRRIKKDIENINLIESIQDLKPRYYYNKISKKKEFGFIADELQEILPELVNGEINQYDKDHNPVLQTVNYTQMIPILVYYIQKLEKRIETLEDKIKE